MALVICWVFFTERIRRRISMRLGMCRALLQEIKDKKVLDDGLRGKLHAVIKEFKDRFVAEQPAVAHA